MKSDGDKEEKVENKFDLDKLIENNRKKIKQKQKEPALFLRTSSNDSIQ